MSWWTPIVLKAVDLGFDGLEYAADRYARWQRKQRAAKAWAETKASVRACHRCREIAYTPGQTVCTKCGATL